MFIIDFRNKLVSNNNFSVIGNNNVDVVYFYSHFTQYASGYNVYLKVISEDERYIDKILIDSENISIEGDALLVKWTMGEVSTQCKKIDVQLQFENNDGSIIAQTRIVSITLGDTIDADTLIPIIYPKILKELQEQIDTLKHDSVAGYTMSYTSDTLIINLKNKNGDEVATNQITIQTSTSVTGASLDGNTLVLTRRSGENPIQVDLSSLIVDISGKVDKVNTSNKVYGTDGSGNQTTYALDNGTGYSGNVARRDTSNQLHVPQTPTADDHAVSKKYADKLVADIKKDSYKEVDTTEYPTLNDFLASTGEEGYLYLYPIDTTDLTKGYYRYVWENNAWLDLGTTQIDLSGYTTDQEFDTHTGNKNNPHEVTKAQVGLGNVDNTSDMNKPVSTAQQQALNEKQNDVCLSVVDGKLCITYEA